MTSLLTQDHTQQDREQAQVRRRGFGAMDPMRQREIAAKGGRAAHRSGNAHEFTSDEARVAGSKGGKAAHQSGNAHQFTSAEAREAGAKGGHARSANRKIPVSS